MPLMQEAVDEELDEQQVFKDIMSNSFHADKEGKIRELKDLENSNDASVNDPFTYKNPMSIKDQDMIMINSRQSSYDGGYGRSVVGSKLVTPSIKALKEIQRENAIKFHNNPNLALLVDRIEQRHSKMSKKAAGNRNRMLTASEELKERTRKFKKPMDTLGQRKLRIEMVKGMT